MTLEELQKQQEASAKQERIDNGERKIDDLLENRNSKTVNISDNEFKLLLLEVENNKDKNIATIKFWVQLWSIISLCGLGIYLLVLLVSALD